MYSEFPALVKYHLPKGLKRLSIFEDFSDDLAIALGYPLHVLVQGYGTDATYILDQMAGEPFAVRSLGLEQLSVVYMINAEDFFWHACKSTTWTWHHLQSLALTS